MRKLKIDRKHYANATTGRVEFEGFFCHSLELPWLNNKTDVSCIPNGIYLCRKIISPNHGNCFEIVDVHERTLIRGHKANFTYELLGCIAFGDSIKDLNNDGVLDVTNSKVTFEKLMGKLPQEFFIEIGQPSMIGIS
jgi:hypothetical protein